MYSVRRHINGMLFLSVSALCAASVWFHLQDEHPEPILETARSAGRVGALPASVQTAVLAAPTGPSAELLRRYNAGSDMRAFVRYALQHPENGGYFYAVKVLQQCQESAVGVRADLLHAYAAGNDAHRAGKVAAASDRLHRRCAEFDFDDVAENRVRGLWKAGRDKDPLIQASVDYSNAFDADYKNPAESAARARALENILKLGDPLLLDDLNLRLALHADEGRKFFALGGRRFDLNSDTDVGAAIYLLPCAAGLACDETEFDMSARCAVGGSCVRSRFEHVEQSVENIPGAYARILAAYDAMRVAVAARDARFFALR